jgi:cytochrome b involved in lipid metabolism
VRVAHPLRFHLPRDPSRPIVMFAGGTGVAPFRGFLQQRARQPGAGPAWLFAAVRTADALPHRTELEDLARRGVVGVRVAVTDEDIVMRFDPAAGRFITAAAPRRRIPDLIGDTETAALLWDLLRSTADRGSGGVFYVCGRAGFAHAVLGALAGVIDRHRPGEAEAFLHRAFADGRVMQDTFTRFASATAPGVLGSGLYDASEVVLHNDEERGYWLVINGAVYDVTGFRHLHPGGPRIVDEYAGTDASREWQAVGHDRSSEVEALLSMYKIGSVRRLALGTAWGVTLAPGGLDYVSLRDLFRAWVRFLYLTVEMQNAFRNDLGYLSLPLVRGDDPAIPSPLRMQLVANSHLRFLRTYFDGVLRSDELQELWAATIGLAFPEEDVLRLRRAVDEVYASADGRALEAYTARMVGFHRLLADGVSVACWTGVEQLLALVQDAGDGFLDGAKQILREGVQAFERHQARTPVVAGDTLRGSLLSLPRVAAAYQARFLAAVRELGRGVPFAP